MFMLLHQPIEGADYPVLRANIAENAQSLALQGYHILKLSSAVRVLNINLLLSLIDSRNASAPAYHIRD
jgi:hypothetical protein